MTKSLLYVKTCLGKDAKPFDIYKIRTMVPNADLLLDEVVQNGLDSLGKPLDDPRITPVGKILRKYWVDETPQLVNLAKGDLKLVGIRPRTEEDWKQYPSDLRSASLDQKPGLFAIQYAFEYTDSFDTNLDMMDSYLKEWSRDPIGTDRKYFQKIMSNIVLRGTRSK